ALSQRLSLQLGQPVVVENRPGANGNIAASAVSRAAPDGYTFLYNSSSLALSPSLYRKTMVDPLHELTPVNGTATLPLVCVVEPSFPASNFAEWVAALKAKPGHYNFGSAGTGNLAHLTPAMILKANALVAVHVPYRGSSEALQGLMSGGTQFQFDSVNSPLALIRAGRLKALFVTSARRSPVLPDVPTLSESGGQKMDISGWQGVMAPPNTPTALVQRFAVEIRKAIESPEMTEALASQGAYAIASSPEQYTAFFTDQMNEFKKVVDDLGVKLD
ncbi:MAG: tripartite tricarboxylate transporter substrate binding protein, partial [Rhizobacter sp.]|nr:tripartite tricarboxylate transporter substrate binding protein [Rhizobacter sp.]